MEDYRKIYENYFNIKIPKGYDIHHIDINRDNNCIDNLVMLPRKLHKQYHFYFNIINKQEIPKNICSFYSPNNFIEPEIYQKYIKIYNECRKWYDLRTYGRYMLKGE